jgi:hypothetical protein
LKGGICAVYRTIAGSEADYESHLKIFKEHLGRQASREKRLAYSDGGFVHPNTAVERRSASKERLLKSRIPDVPLGRLLNRRDMKKVMMAGVDADDVEFPASVDIEADINHALFSNPCARCGDRKNYRRAKAAANW